MQKPTAVFLCTDFGYAAKEPTQTDEATGIRYDFNHGPRLLLPEGLWTVTIGNSVTGDVYLSEKMPGGTSYSFPYKYFIPYFIQATDSTAGKTFSHRLDMGGRSVAFKMPQRTLGDPLYMMAAVRAFIDRTGCHGLVYCSKRIAEILKESNPDIEFVSLADEDPSRPYATYYLGLFFDQNVMYQPYDFRTYSLIQQGQHILGLSDFETLPPPKVTRPAAARTSKKKRIAISYSGSKQCKFWNNPRGWYDVIKWLNESGHTAICIDRDPIYGRAPIVNVMPPGVEDQTGDLSLQERIDVLASCDVFVGTPSGLAALAWCVGVPVVMISGFSLPFAEFPCYRVINAMIDCKGCWNDTRINFNRHDMHWCPRVDPLLAEAQRKLLSIGPDDEKAKLEAEEEVNLLHARKFVCTKSITANMVIEAIGRAIRGEAY